MDKVIWIWTKIERIENLPVTSPLVIETLSLWGYNNRMATTRKGAKIRGGRRRLSEQPVERGITPELFQKTFRKLDKKLSESLNTKLTDFEERIKERLVKLK